MRRLLGDLMRRGPRVFLRKSWILAGLCLAVVPLVIVRLLRPLIVIRFGNLGSQRIARFIGETETYLSELDAGMHRGRYVDVFYNNQYICNYQLKRMWDRTVRVIQPAKQVDRLNRLIPGGKIHCIPRRGDQDIDIHGILPGTKPHLAFTRDEEQAGQAGLREMGIPDGAPFVCFHARDLSYEVELGAGVEEERVSPANSDIRSYLPAAEEMARRGLFALRMGAVVTEPLTLDNPMVIDYATKARTELLDLYLGAKCEFFIGSVSGILGIPMAFRRPAVHTNFICIGDYVKWIVSWQPHDMWIPKKFWLRDERRFMTKSEIVESEDGALAGAWWRRETGIELVENTAEEITAVAIEIKARLKGTWRGTKMDEELQREFWSLYVPSEANTVPRARIGAEFLRNHPELLE